MGVYPIKIDDNAMTIFSRFFVICNKQKCVKKQTKKSIE